MSPHPDTCILRLQETTIPMGGKDENDHSLAFIYIECFGTVRANP